MVPPCASMASLQNGETQPDGVVSSIPARSASVPNFSKIFSLASGGTPVPLVVHRDSYDPVAARDGDADRLPAGEYLMPLLTKFSMTRRTSGAVARHLGGPRARRRRQRGRCQGFQPGAHVAGHLRQIPHRPLDRHAARLEPAHVEHIARHGRHLPDRLER